jgi:hypothetical protein
VPLPPYAGWHHAAAQVVPMGDKSPKSKDKNKKQNDSQKKNDKAAHDKKQAPPAPAGKK